MLTAQLTGTRSTPKVGDKLKLTDRLSVAEVTICPSCKGLCLGASILPCNHAICRKCLRLGMEENAPLCATCDTPYVDSKRRQSISVVTNQMSMDNVLHDLCIAKLTGLRYCSVYPLTHKTALKVCLDCAEMFCDVCSKTHRTMSATADHLQTDLPEEDLLRPSLIFQPGQAPEGSERPSEDQESKDKRTRSPDPAKRAQAARRRKMEKTLKQEARNCQKMATRMKTALLAVDENTDLLTRVRDILHSRMELFEAYYLRLSSPGNLLMEQGSGMIPRVQKVRTEYRPPSNSVINALTEAILNLLLHAKRETVFDPMTAIPQKTFMKVLDAEEDSDPRGPFIHKILPTDDDRLVMIDQHNNAVKVVEPFNPYGQVKSIVLDCMPQSLAIMDDDEVIVAFGTHRLQYVDIVAMKTEDYVETQRCYHGVAAVSEDDALVATCQGLDGGIVCVDLVSREGKLLKTLGDVGTLPGLSKPFKVCAANGDVLVADYEAQAVFRIQTATGRLIDKLVHPELKWPSQISADVHGNYYFASTDGHCVLVVNQQGQWRRLLYGPEDGEWPRTQPYAICVFDRGIALTWHKFGKNSVLVGYDLTTGVSESRSDMSISDIGATGV